MDEPCKGTSTYGASKSRHFPCKNKGKHDGFCWRHHPDKAKLKAIGKPPSLEYVRAVLWPLLEDHQKALRLLGPIMEPYWDLPVHKSEDDSIEMRAVGFLYDRVEDCMKAAVHACAKALLALPPDAPSPLD